MELEDEEKGDPTVENTTEDELKTTEDELKALKMN